MSLNRSTLQLLRFPFSFLLMPVYWFAMSQVVHPDAFRGILIFFILHLLVYPASNGYNSYMDRDTGPVGGYRKTTVAGAPVAEGLQYDGHYILRAWAWPSAAGLPPGCWSISLRRELIAAAASG